MVDANDGVPFEHYNTAQMLVRASLLNIIILLKCLCLKSLGCELSRSRICGASVTTKAASLSRNMFVQC